MANEKTNKSGAAVDTSGWDKAQTGFAPYWAPQEPGDSITGELIDFDPGNADTFPRYIFRALEDTKCFRGGGQERTEVVVKKGDHFTISEYNQLKPHLDLYLFCVQQKGFAVPCMLKAEEKIPTKGNREVWNWDVRTNPSVAKQLQAARVEFQQGAKSLPAAAG